MIEQNPKALETNPLADPRRCLDCHAPLKGYGDDKAVTNGITCQACHTVRRVRPSASGHSLVFDHRGIIYGSTEHPSKDAPHRIKHSRDFEDSRLCAGCHQDRLATGLFLERTYDEWLHSPYAKEGINCSDCHMPQSPGPATDNVTTRTSHASHQFAGGHADSPLLKGAARLEVRESTNKKQINVTVVNANVGHHFPTGGAHPNKLVLHLRLINEENESLYQQQRVYRYGYLDLNGQPLPPNKVQDTTLRPKESRLEHFPIPEDLAPAKVIAWLEYHIIPEKIGQTLPPDLYRNSYAPVMIDNVELQLE